VFHCGQCNFDLCLNCGNGVQNQHENVEEGHGGGHGRWGQGGAGFGRGGGVGRRRFGRDGEHRHHQEQGKLHESKFVPGRKHDFGRLGGHKFSTHQGLYGSKLDSGAQHTTIPASAVAQQYESFDADVKAKVESKVAKINLETGRSLAKSDLTGNKKALLIGCNYIGSKNELKGCVNDVMNMKKFIISTFGFQDDPNHLRVLLNDECTRVKMIYLMQWLVEGAKAGDSLFLHYSGHGATQASFFRLSSLLLPLKKIRFPQPDKGPVLDEPTGMVVEALGEVFSPFFLKKKNRMRRLFLSITNRTA
jgi:hypothetical protein